jgi:hypothetical protein
MRTTSNNNIVGLVYIIALSMVIMQKQNALAYCRETQEKVLLEWPQITQLPFSFFVAIKMLYLFLSRGKCYNLFYDQNFIV